LLTLIFLGESYGQCKSQLYLWHRCACHSGDIDTRETFPVAVLEIKTLTRFAITFLANTLEMLSDSNQRPKSFKEFTSRYFLQ
jgi:hypothetical protein